MVSSLVQLSSILCNEGKCIYYTHFGTWIVLGWMLCELVKSIKRGWKSLLNLPKDLVARFSRREGVLDDGGA